MKQIAFSKDALRTLSRMPANASLLIRSKIAQYVADPSTQANNIKTLKGQYGVYRLRVGDWRILLTETGEVITVIKVGPRGGAYQ